MSTAALPKALPALALALIGAWLAVGCAGLSPEHGPLEQDVLWRAQTAKPASPDDSDLMYALMAGEMAGHAGDITQAIGHYNIAARMTDDPRVAERATRIALFGDSSAEALEAARRWSELAPQDLEAHQTLGVLFVREQKLDQALIEFERVIAAERHEDKGFYVVAAALAEEKNPEAALTVMRRLLERYPDEAQGQIAYAGLALQHHREPEAVAAADRALAINPKLTEARILRARAFAGMGEYERALTDMKAVAQTSKDKDLKFGYAKLLVQAKRYEDARLEFGKLLKATPGDPDLLYGLGLLNLQDKRYDDAHQNFSSLLKTRKRTNESRFYLARTEEARGDLNDALSWYAKIDRGNYYLDAQIGIASLKAKIGGVEKGVTYLRKLHGEADDPESKVQYYLAEGQLLREAREYQRGFDTLNEALQEFPGNADLLYARALMAEKLDRIDLLESDLRSILKDEPDNAGALNALGFTLADRNLRIEEARGYIEQAFKARPDDPAVMDSMGWVLFRMGQYPEAERHLRKAYSLLEDGEIAGHLSEIVWTSGRHEEARALIEKAIGQYPDHEYLKKLRERFAP